MTRYPSWVCVFKMQFRVVFVFALIAACSASLAGTNSYTVSIGPENILVSNDLGTQINIAANPAANLGGLGWTQPILIQVSGPDVSPQTIQIPDQQAGIANQPQSAILYQILTQFSGVLDEVTYQQLLTVIAQQVQAGLIDPAILNALQAVSISSQSTAWGNPLVSQLGSTRGAQSWWYGKTPAWSNWQTPAWSAWKSPAWSAWKSPAWSNWQTPAWSAWKSPAWSAWKSPAWSAWKSPIWSAWSEWKSPAWTNWQAISGYGPYAPGVSQTSLGLGDRWSSWWPKSSWAQWQGGLPLDLQNQGVSGCGCPLSTWWPKSIARSWWQTPDFWYRWRSGIALGQQNLAPVFA